jgi:Arc/MetJ family transcription regulator
VTERSKAAWDRLRQMYEEGLLDLDRIVDLNESVDEALLQEAMRALGVDARTEAINRSLRIAIGSLRTADD